MNKEQIEKKGKDNKTIQRADLFLENYENGFFPRMSEGESLNMSKFDIGDRKKSLRSFELFLRDGLNSGRD